MVPQRMLSNGPLPHLNLVTSMPCDIKFRRWLRMRLATGFELLLGVVVLTADFKFRMESGKIAPSDPLSRRSTNAVKLA